MKQKTIIFQFFTLFVASQMVAQTYELDARVKSMEIRSSHLKMGGTNLLCELIDVNNLNSKRQ
ncbi:MAG TPA: hypothetical protein VFC65_03825 [Prolixibacteraceae bacterium]|nr:hypothetical protein [Prolixibacteraceae bacterium]